MKQIGNVKDRDRDKEYIVIFKTEIMKEKLVKFLKSKKAYAAFCRNYINIECNSAADEHTTVRLYLEWVDDKRAVQALSSAFLWGESEEGFDFWRELDVEFIKLHGDKKQQIDL